MHLPGGFSRVVFTREAEGAEIDIPTEVIPPHLRGFDSTFVVVLAGFMPERGDGWGEIRWACRQAVRVIEA